MPALHRQTRPIYRTVLADAFRLAWQQKRYWPLALFASFLFTAGVYDVLLNAVLTTTPSRDFEVTTSSPLWTQLQTVWNGQVSSVNLLSGIQATLALAVLLLTLVVLSCVSQAGLVYAIGASKRGKRSPTLKEAFGVGARAFWPVAALNALLLSALWAIRFLSSFPLALALEQPNSGVRLLYLLSFIVFAASSFVISLVHIFALNAMILQGAPLAEAILRGFDVFRRHWVVAIETALLLFVISLGVASASVVAFFFLTLPLSAALITTLSAGFSFPFVLVTGMSLAILVLFLMSVAAFLTQLQYTSWTLLYRRLGEGGALPKIHRWIRSLCGVTTIPRS